MTSRSPALILRSLLPSGSLLRLHRINQGLTQRELGERANMAPKYISELERGAKRGGVRGWKRLADALSIEVVDMIDRYERPA